MITLQNHFHTRTDSMDELTAFFRDIAPMLSQPMDAVIAKMSNEKVDFAGK